MDTATLARYTGASRSEIDRLFKLSGEDIIQDAGFKKMTESIDLALLKKTLPQARQRYDERLPALQNKLTERYGINAEVMSSHTLGNWIVGALEFPQYIPSLTANHGSVPREVFSKEMQSLLDMVDDIPEGADEWQKALCIFVIPLMRKS